MIFFRAQAIAIILVLGVFLASMIYSYNRCGWGMLAYESPLIAALAGECAQQQRLAPAAP